jgi:pimeloyl-ACP methyl ester carboxylesterase
MRQEIDGTTVHTTGSRLTPDRPFLLWHHGSPQTGAVIAPVAAAARQAGIEVVSIARPGYAGAPRIPGRTVFDVAEGIRRILDRMNAGPFVTAGASGGGPHALACAALMPERAIAVVTLASPAPYRPGREWFSGMQAPGGLRAALEGEEARIRFVAEDEFDPESFTASDYAALRGEWAALGDDVGEAEQFGPWGLVDDDLAFTRDWGFDLSNVTARTLLYQGSDDRVIPAQHARMLHAALPNSDLREFGGAGHISVLDHLADALAESVGAGR